MADDILPGRVATLAGATDVARALAEVTDWRRDQWDLAGDAAVRDAVHAVERETKLDLRWADEDDAAGLE